MQKQKMNIKTFCAIILILVQTNITDPIYGAEKIELTISGAIEAALINNLDLKVEKLNPEIAQQTTIVEKSLFDPVFTIETSGSTTGADYDGATVDSSTYNTEATISKKFAPGTSVSLSLAYSNNSVETESTDGDGSSTLLSLTVTQPLLKNRGNEINNRNIALSANNLKTAQLSIKKAVIDTVSQAQILYWQHYNALANLEVQKKSLELAQESMAEIEEKIAIGSSPRIDLLSSKSEVASREEGVIAAENEVHNSRDELLYYIHGKIPNDVEIICRDKPSFKQEQYNEKILTEYALENRTDYLTKKIQLDSAGIDKKYFKNQRMPQLDLTGVIGVNDGSTDDEEMSQFQSSDYSDYQYGMLTLSLELPIGSRRDKANYSSAVIKRRQAAIEAEKARSLIGLEVRTALRDLRSAHKRYQAAHLAGQYAMESLKTEQEKLANGLSTSYQLLLHQRDFADAKTAEVEAVVGYQKAVITLHSTLGSTLEEHNIQINGEQL